MEAKEIEYLFLNFSTEGLYLRNKPIAASQAPFYTSPSNSKSHITTNAKIRILELSYKQ